MKIFFRLILISFVCLALLSVIDIALTERVFTPYPEISTQLSSVEVNSRFDLIKSDVGEAVVLGHLGEPFEKSGGTFGCWDGKMTKASTDLSKDFAQVSGIEEAPEGYEVWSYSKRDRNAWIKAAWLEYRVVFQDHTVLRTEKCWHAA